MIARQIREQRHVELDAIDAALDQSVRGDFHRDRLRARILPAAQHFVQRRGIGRRVQRRLDRAVQAVAQRARDRRGASHGREGLRNPVRARCLAVGPGHAYGPQLLRRVIVDLVGDESESLPEVGDADVRRAPDRRPLVSGFFPQHAAGPPLQRIRNERASVAGLARIGGECVARHDGAAVGGDPAHRRAQAREHGRGIDRGRARGDHTSSMTGGSSGAGRITLSSGASCGTLSARNVASVIRLNTGAATVPP